MSDEAYALLAPPIRRILWDMRWQALRPIQVQAIHEIAERKGDLIISAPTASGKTEAAFLPILSALFTQRAASVQAIYVGPLKALINDQFRRLEALCQRAQIAVHRWHGDVSAGRKRALVRDPSGVLLITPESVESLLINRSTDLDRMFRQLRFVVIDELHALVGCERGTHLRSLLYRLEPCSSAEQRIVGLSATLGDALAAYANWLRPDDPGRVRLLRDAQPQKRVLYKIHGYLGGADTMKQGSVEGQPSETPSRIIKAMVGHFSGNKNLVFANCRADVEWLADGLNEICRNSGRPEEFLIHHGSLGKQIREFTERAMREGPPRTTICSSSLELGIDLGNVAAIGQVGPPWSVRSLVQRLGRSGREEGQPQSMRVYLSQRRANAQAPLEKRLYPDLLQAIALTELMLEEPMWVEPPTCEALDLSTLTQQILSVLAQTGGIAAERLFGRLVTKGAFRQVSCPMFAALLRSLAAHQLIQQLKSGELILAPEGEAIVADRAFYAAFATPVEFAVMYNSVLVGQLPAQSVPRRGDHFLLAARRWSVVDVDTARQTILVAPARGRKKPRFDGAPLGAMHPRVRQTMREVLLGGRQFGYLDRTAQRLLHDARQVARQAGLHAISLVPLSDGCSMWFTWTGTRIQLTLYLMTQAVGLACWDREIALGFDASSPDVLRRLELALDSATDALALASALPNKCWRKYDAFIADDLLTRALAEDVLDVPGARQAILELLDQHVE